MGTSYAEAVAVASPSPSIQAMAGRLAGCPWFLLLPLSRFRALSPLSRWYLPSSPRPPARASSLRRPSGTKYPFTKQRKTVTCAGRNKGLDGQSWQNGREHGCIGMGAFRSFDTWVGSGLGKEKAPLWPGPPPRRRLDVMFRRAVKKL